MPLERNELPARRPWATHIARRLGLVVTATVFIGFAIAQLYAPLRLKYTGTLRVGRVLEVQRSPAAGTQGSFVPESFRFSVSGRSDPILTFSPEFKGIEKGDTVSYFASDRIELALICADGPPGLWQLFSDSGAAYGLALILSALVIGCFLIYDAASRFKAELMRRLGSIESQTIAGTSRGGRFLAYSADLVPLLVLIAFTYFMLILTSKASLSVERSSVYGTGLIISSSFTLMLYAPFLYVGLNHAFSTYPRLIFVKQAAKTLLGIWGVVKLLDFLRTMDLTHYKSVRDVLVDILESFFSF